MWKLSARGKRGSQFVELGAHASLADAAARILKLENDPLRALFFRVYVDPASTRHDSEALSRLEYRTDDRFYLLTRDVC